MGKRKAADSLGPLTDSKKQRKRTAKPVTKPKKTFEEIDQLFEEVEAILNCSPNHNGASLGKNALVPPGKIQDYFKKRSKDQDLDPGSSRNSAIILTTHLLSIPPSNAITNTTNALVHRSGSPHVGTVGNILNPAIPLSPATNLIPNIPCRNRFEALAEDDETPRGFDIISDDTNKEIIQSTPRQVPVSPLTHPVTEPSNALILQRIEEVRSLVLQMAKCFRESLERGCKCKYRDEEANLDHTMPDSILTTQLAQGGQVNDHQKEKSNRVGLDGNATRLEFNITQASRHRKRPLDEGDTMGNHIAINKLPSGPSNHPPAKSCK
ncbi:hypothetical protein NDU88_003156 [Pleurodeles waltl]|uniref:Uncharacterized protein n=1 Tax=Pleurodeles waltl TaxID=8319 RepID=A0AAV7M2M6_PLEWA|nr:hypothetical protein NDU88_003156 [Pleurodeles waltl]